jgi:hypothetical protein
MVNQFPKKGLPLNQYTWRQISEISRAGLAKEYWKIGETKAWVFNKTIYQAQIVGFDHDEVNEPHTIQDVGGKIVTPYPRKFAGITFELCGGIGQNTKNGVLKIDPMVFYRGPVEDYNGYDTSTVTEVVNNLMNHPSIIDCGIADVVVPVTKKSAIIDGSIFIRIGGDYFFLPSVSEIIGIKNAPRNEGTQYALYQKLGLTYTRGNRFIRYGGGTPRPWWTRTVYSEPNGQPSKRGVLAFTNKGELKLAPITSRLYLAPLFCV